MGLNRILSTTARIFAFSGLFGCTSEPTTGGAPNGSDGAVASGGSSGSGGAASGGMSSGGTSIGGASGGSSGAGGAAGGGGSNPGSGGRSGAGGGVGTGGAPSATGGAPSSDAGPPTTPRTAACPPNQTYGDPLPSNRNATPVMGGFGFTEGPLWIAETGRLLFSDMDFNGGDATGPPSVIRYLDFSGGSPTARQFVNSGSNGLALANDGRILAATHDVQSLSYFDTTTGNRTNWPLLYQGNHFNSPNDLVVRADGNVYFTDPNWQLGSRTSETGIEGFYRVSPSGNVTLINGGVTKANGVTLSPDEQTLYMGGQSGGIQRFALDASGAPGPRSQFAPGSTDGMTVDCAGNVYVTSNDVVVYGRSGNERGRITLGGSPSNVAFGGASRTTLFITAGSSLYSIDMNVPGMPY